MRRIVLLQQIVQEVSAAPDLAGALRIIEERVSVAMQADVCSIFLAEPRTRTLVLSATKGLDSAAVGKVRLNLD